MKQQQTKNAAPVSASAVLVALSILAGPPARAAPAAAPAEASSLELEALVSGGIYSLNGAGLSFGGLSGTVGLPLGRRVVLQTGIGLSAGGHTEPGREQSNLQVSIPLLLKVHFTPPRARRVGGYLRVGGTYGFYRASADPPAEGSSMEGSVHNVSGFGALGLQYLLTARVGLMTELGLRYQRSFASGDWYYDGSWGLGAEWRSGLLIRL